MVKDLIFKIDFNGDWDIIQAPNNGEWNEQTIKEWYLGEVSDDTEFEISQLTKEQQEAITVVFEEDPDWRPTLFEFAEANEPIYQPTITVSTNY